MNLAGIRGGVLRPIEAQQTIAALAIARQRYLDAIIGYNQAQLELMRSIGQPPAPDSAAVADSTDTEAIEAETNDAPYAPSAHA